MKDEMLQETLDAMSSEELDNLDFGVIKMSLDGVVIEYNATERRGSGLRMDQVMGLDFFVEVAPCMNNYLVAQKFIDNDELDETLDFILTFRMAPTPVEMRLLKSKAAGTQYVLIDRK